MLEAPSYYHVWKGPLVRSSQHLGYFILWEWDYGLMLEHLLCVHVRLCLGMIEDVLVGFNWLVWIWLLIPITMCVLMRWLFYMRKRLNQSLCPGEYLALTGERLDLTDMIMTSLVRSPIDSKVRVFLVSSQKRMFSPFYIYWIIWLPSLCPLQRIPEIMHQLHSLDTTDEEIVEHILEGFEDGIEVDPDSFLHRYTCFSINTL